MLLNLSHHYSIAIVILYDTMGQTEIDGDQIFRLPSVFIGFASLLIQLIHRVNCCFTVKRIDEKLSFAFVLKGCL